MIQFEKKRKIIQLIRGDQPPKLEKENIIFGLIFCLVLINAFDEQKNDEINSLTNPKTSEQSYPKKKCYVHNIFTMLCPGSKMEQNRMIIREWKGKEWNVFKQGK